ncbi:sensor histidine kinase [Loktanella sp. IMCC34160]|uniref:sensor histidine kinase n=1 Tax=Loktanella sp. IMCC34160 TaxID=2510646 RepID=UPI00101DA2E4|nr:ATP-binding protein [Loktanella sp. IMCC34160]RYG91995.1 sensor histidine kinase [Loktanella sp. IMCC34160]
MFAPRLRRLAVILSFLAAVAAVAGGVWAYGYAGALRQLQSRGQSDLALAGDRLTGELQQFRSLAVLMADHPTVTGLLAGTVDPATSRALLLEVADKTGSLDVIVVDQTGRERAAASGTPPDPHAGRPYYERAMDGALGVYHQLSDRYGRRTFLFAAPVFSEDGPPSGAVLVLADVEEVEAVWRGDRPTVFFTDELGVIFVSNRSELVFRSRTGDMRAAGQSAEYPTGRIMPFVHYEARLWQGMDLWRVDAGRYVPERALHLELDLPVIGLVGEALLDVAPARQLALLQATVTAALCLAFGALLFLATERRRTLAEANQRLEARVAQRTAELSDLNADLLREVAERTAAEARLKKAQADLVQAGKLSALGQMSAGISHELNQPLMAIRSFAENAEVFLAKGKQDVAAQNLTRISDLARRMGRIIRNLRAFARQESEALSDVDITAVVDVVLEMASARLTQSTVTVIWDRPSGPVMVRGGEVRLQQVILNLVTNAVDAMEETGEKRLEIGVSSEGAKVFVTVRDTGPGIDEPEKIFDPFYSTKTVGSGDGMGLGLSISYGLVQSFGGNIRGRNHPDGGAVFTVELAGVAGKGGA